MNRQSGQSGCAKSLLVLNDDCLLKIWTYLGLCDSINLAETCNRLKSLADVRYKKFSKLTSCDWTMNRQENLRMNYILSHIGEYIVILNFNARSLNSDMRNNFLTAVNKNCNCLKELKIRNWNDRTFKNFKYFKCFENVKILTLIDCNFNSDQSFFSCFRKLEFLNIDYLNYSKCATPSEVKRDVKELLKNNHNLRSFYYCHQDPEYNCDLRNFERHLKLEALRLDIPNIFQCTSFNNFDCLTKLSLYCKSKNVNEILIQLAEKGTIEELELHMVQFDEHSYNVLQSFSKLHLLVVVIDGENEIAPLFGWPSNLKSLTLALFKISLNHLLSTIEQLKYLENIDLLQSSLDVDKANLNDVPSLSQQIQRAISCHEKKRRLNVILPKNVAFDKDGSKKYLVDTNGLRIFNKNWDHFRKTHRSRMFNINFNFDLYSD